MLETYTRQLDQYQLIQCKEVNRQKEYFLFNVDASFDFEDFAKSNSFYFHRNYDNAERYGGFTFKEYKKLIGKYTLKFRVAFINEQPKQVEFNQYYDWS